MDPQQTILQTPTTPVSVPTLSTVVTVPEIPVFCKYCHLQISKQDYFCPHCGKKLKDKPVSLGVLALLWLLILSTLLPPLGIGLTIRYIRAEEDRAKTIGWISLLITVISAVIAVVLTISALKSFNQQFNSQLQNYQF